MKYSVINFYCYETKLYSSKLSELAEMVSCILTDSDYDINLNRKNQKHENIFENN